MKHHKSTTGEDGFTLLELLVTLTVASLLLTIVVPHLLDTVAHARLEASASQVTLALRETRMVAMKSSQSARLMISGANYSVAGKSQRLPSGQSLWLRRKEKGESKAESSIEFFPDGSSNGGTITIANAHDHVSVNIDWLTGRISSGD